MPRLDVLGKRYEIISDHRCSVRMRFAKRIKSHLMNERKKSLCSELFICLGCARIFLEERKNDHEAFDLTKADFQGKRYGNLNIAPRTNRRMQRREAVASHRAWPRRSAKK